MLEESQIQKLVQASQDGDRESFGLIYEEFASRIFNFLIVRVKHKQVAEDLLHTVFLKAWTNINSYVQTGAKFSTWLFQIANFTLIDYWRVKKDTVELDKVENAAAFSTNAQAYEKYDYLYNVMSDLPQDQQTVLELRFRQDMSVEETATIMNKSQVAIRVLQHRAIKALRSRLNAKGLI
jgi:RNA polymerase sigma-70 factor (ECF subfamily)